MLLLQASERVADELQLSAHDLSRVPEVFQILRMRTEVEAAELPTESRVASRLTVLGSNPRQTVPHESTTRYFPGSFLSALSDHIDEYVKVRDADKHPTVPDRLRMRNLPQTADFDALRALIEAAWEAAWDELACSFALLHPCDAVGMYHERYNMAVCLWYGPLAFDGRYGLVINGDTLEYRDDIPEIESLEKCGGGRSYEEQLRHVETDGSFLSLRPLGSPKWRAWFLDTWQDRVAIHDVMVKCGVKSKGHLAEDFHELRYVFDADVSHMSIEEFVNRLDAKHSFMVAAFRAAHAGALRPGFAPRRVASRPPDLDAMMEMVTRLKNENVQWKEIKEQVEKMFRYRFDSEDALRKSFERWLKGQNTAE